MERVKIYGFIVYDISTGRQLPSSRLATLATISKIEGAAPILDSEQEVDSDLIDAEGFYGR